MPYDSIQELPESVREHLPKHTQEIYREAYNHAWEEYKDPGERRGSDSRETVAHKVAWSAVEKKYKKDESGRWREK